MGRLSIGELVIVMFISSYHHVVAFFKELIFLLFYFVDCIVPRLPGFGLDVPAIVEAVRRDEPKIVFLTSPNNPDGW